MMRFARHEAGLLPLLLCAACAPGRHEVPLAACADAGCVEVGVPDSAVAPDSAGPPDSAPDAGGADAVEHYAHQLAVPFHNQRSETPAPWNPSTSCGPTALLMLLDHLALESTLEPVLQHASAIPPAEGGYDPGCTAEGNPVCTSPGALARIAHEQYGLQVDARDRWELADVRSALQQGRPVIADVGGPRGHFVVLTGLVQDAAGLRVTYSDPAQGPDRSMTWESFATTLWSGPVDIGDPLQPEGHASWGMVAYP